MLVNRTTLLLKNALITLNINSLLVPVLHCLANSFWTKWAKHFFSKCKHKQEVNIHCLAKLTHPVVMQILLPLVWCILYFPHFSYFSYASLHWIVRNPLNYIMLVTYGKHYLDSWLKGCASYLSHVAFKTWLSTVKCYMMHINHQSFIVNHCNTFLIVLTTFEICLDAIEELSSCLPYVGCAFFKCSISLEG